MHHWYVRRSTYRIGFNPRKGCEMHLMAPIIRRTDRFVSIPARGARCIRHSRAARLWYWTQFQSPQGVRDASSTFNDLEKYLMNVSIPARGARCITAVGTVSYAMGGFNPRKGCEMHRNVGDEYLGRSRFNPRKGCEMHLFSSGSFTPTNCFNPRKGCEMHH